MSTTVHSTARCVSVPLDVSHSEDSEYEKSMNF